MRRGTQSHARLPYTTPGNSRVRSEHGAGRVAVGVSAPLRKRSVLAMGPCAHAEHVNHPQLHTPRHNPMRA